MITFSKTDSSIIERAKRILKVIQFGAKTAKESSPYGFDSSPIKGMTAIYAETSNKAESVVVGYINKNQLAEIGEARIYSTNEAGTTMATIFLKNTGDIHLNGNEYSAVRFEPLSQSVQEMRDAINMELSNIAFAITSLSGTYAPTPLNTNINSSKSQTVKIK